MSSEREFFSSVPMPKQSDYFKEELTLPTYFKGVDKNGKGRGNSDYKVGYTYWLNQELKLQETKGLKTIENLRAMGLSKHFPITCSDRAIHFGKTLESCFNFFHPKDSSRYFIVTPIGETNIKDYKSGSCALYINSEITEEIEERVFNESEPIKSLHIIMDKFPQTIVGGSLGLKLQGIELDRMSSFKFDLDLTFPYYVDLEEAGATLTSNRDVDYEEDENSFDSHHKLGDTKIDFVVSPRRKYISVEYCGRTYKVIPYLNILKYKMEYALKGHPKHEKDFKELLNIKK